MKNHMHKIEEGLVLLEERVMAYGLVQVDQRRPHEYNELSREIQKTLRTIREVEVQDASTRALKRRGDNLLAELICMQPAAVFAVA